MSVSVNAEEPLVDAWRVALAHSGLDEEDFYLLSCPGAIVVGRAKGASYEPGVEQDEDDFLSGSILTEANELANRRKHRVAVFEDVDWDDPVKVALLTAILRHEIEHARQRMLCGGVLFAVDQYADDAIEFKAGGLPGSTVLYNFKPTEQDANAAAAMLLAAEFPGERWEILKSEDAVLARSLIPPGDPPTLLARTVCFIFLFAEIVEAKSQEPNGITFDRRLDCVSSEAGDLWRHLIAQRQELR